MTITMEHGTRIPRIEITKGMRLAAARDDAGFTQDRMAELLGCTRRTIVRWETGAPIPPVVVISYSVATDVNLGWLETGEAPAEIEEAPHLARGSGASSVHPPGLEPGTH